MNNLGDAASALPMTNQPRSAGARARSRLRLPLSCLPLLATAGCATMRAQLLASARDAATQTSTCAAVTLTPLRSWAFRADGCGQKAYWRCATAKHFDVCCEPLQTEAEAVRTILATSHILEVPAETLFDPDRKLDWPRKSYLYCYNYEDGWHFTRD